MSVSTEVAGLQIEVDATPIVASYKALDKLTDAATRADIAIQALNAEARDLSTLTKAFGITASAVTPITENLKRASGATSNLDTIAAAADKTTAALNRVSDAAGGVPSTFRGSIGAAAGADSAPRAAPTAGTALTAAATVDTTGSADASIAANSALVASQELVTDSLGKQTAATLVAAGANDVLTKSKLDIRRANIGEAITDETRTLHDFGGAVGTVTAQTAQMAAAFSSAGRIQGVAISPQATQRLKEYRAALADLPGGAELYIAAENAIVTAEAGEAAGFSRSTIAAKARLQTLGAAPTEAAVYINSLAGVSAAELRESAITAAATETRLEELAAEKLVAAASDKVRDSVVSSAAAKLADTAATNAQSQAFRLNATETREILTLFREGASGRFSRLPGSFTLLAQQGHLAQIAIAAVTNPLVIAGVALTAFAAATIEAALHAETMDRAIRSAQVGLEGTGRAAVVSRSQIAGYIQALNELPGVNAKSAGESENTLLRIPNLDTSEIASVNKILPDFAALTQLTGEKLPEAAKKLAEALKDPVKGSQQLAEEFGRLSPGQLAAIQGLQQTGHEAEALRLLIDSLAKATDGLAEKSFTPTEAAAARLSKAWTDLGDKFSETGFINGVRDTFAHFIDQLAATISQIQQVNQAIDNFGPRVPKPDSVAGKVLGGVNQFVGDAISSPAGFFSAVPKLIDRVTAPPPQAVSKEEDTTSSSPAYESQASAAHAAAASVVDAKQIETNAEAAHLRAVNETTKGLISQGARAKQIADEIRTLQKELADPAFVAGLSPAQSKVARDKVQDTIQALREQQEKKDSTYDSKKLELSQAIAKNEAEAANIASGKLESENQYTTKLEQELADKKISNALSASEKANLREEAKQADASDLVVTSTKTLTSKRDELDQGTAKDNAETANITAGRISSQGEYLRQLDEELAKKAASLDLDKNANVSAADKARNEAQIAAARAAAIKRDTSAQDLASAKTNSDLPGRIDEVNSQTDRLQGNTAGAQLEQISRTYDKFFKDLQAQADESGSKIDAELVAKLGAGIAKLKEVASITDQITELEKSAQTAEQSNTDVSKTVAAKESAGLITEAEGHKQQVAANLALADSLENNYIPALQKLIALQAAEGGNTDANREKLLAYQLQIIELRSHTNELADALESTFKNSLTSNIDAILERTKTLQQGLQAFAKDLQHTLIDSVVKKGVDSLATNIFNGFKGLGGIFGLGSKPAGASPIPAGAIALNTASSVAAAAEGPASGAASAATNTASDAATTAALTTAFTAGATAIGTAITSAFATGAATAAEAISTALASGGATSGIGSTVASVAADEGPAFSSGGFTGAGAKQEPAGIVHKGEFVHRSEVVQQPGALSFLHAFNQHGMDALPGYSVGGLVGGESVPRGAPGFASGGLVTSSAAPSAPDVSSAQTTTVSSTLNQSFVTGGQYLGGSISSSGATAGQQIGGSMTTAGFQVGQTLSQAIIAANAIKAAGGATQPGTGLSDGLPNNYSRKPSEFDTFARIAVTVGPGLVKGLVGGSGGSSPQLSAADQDGLTQGAINATAPDVDPYTASGIKPYAAGGFVAHGLAASPPVAHFSVGGYTGPGTKFQPAGVVHAGEFVHRQEVVQQPGAMAFLSHFNDVGMSAVANWRGYAAGGAVSMPVGTHSEPHARLGASPGLLGAPGYVVGGPVTPWSGAPQGLSLPANPASSSRLSQPARVALGDQPGHSKSPQQQQPIKLVLSSEHMGLRVQDLVDRHIADQFAKR